MDWGHTNAQQVARWDERNTPSSVSQAHAYALSIEISSIQETSTTLFSGDKVVLVTTAEPHLLTRGQRIQILEANGEVIVENGPTYSLNVVNQMVEVIRETTFVVSFADWTWNESYEVSSICSIYYGSSTDSSRARSIVGLSDSIREPLDARRMVLCAAFGHR